MRLRIKFSKTGPMRYISHLDIMRFFQKALKRADADVSMSEGFSPHMLMSFALPLSLGMESVGEYFDVDVNSCSSTEKLMEDLNRQMCEGCRIFSVKNIPQDKANKCMTQVAAADYSVFVKAAVKNSEKPYAAEDYGISGKPDMDDDYHISGNCAAGESIGSGTEPDADFLREKAAAFSELPEIKVLKKTKKGEKEEDIKPFIYAFDYKEDRFELRIGAGSVNHVRCDLVMSRFFEYAGISEDTLRVDIRRDDLLLETEKGFAPLDSIGEVRR